MEWLTQFVLRTWLPPGLWALGTRLEPLVTMRHRAQPLSDDEVTPQVIERLELHFARFAKEIAAVTLATLAVISVLVIEGVLAPEALDQLSRMPFNEGVYLSLAVLVSLRDFVLFLALLACVAWDVRLMSRLLGSSENGLSDRLVLALKTKSLEADSIELLRGLPRESALRVYLSSLLAD